MVLLYKEFTGENFCAVLKHNETLSNPEFNAIFQNVNSNSCLEIFEGIAVSIKITTGSTPYCYIKFYLETYVDPETVKKYEME